jgi:hypothetical protein
LIAEALTALSFSVFIFAHLTLKKDKAESNDEAAKTERQLNAIIEQIGVKVSIFSKRPADPLELFKIAKT